MTQQATLAFDTLPADPGDRTGFAIGWDHAHHGLVPPAELLTAGTPIAQGWQAGRAVFGRRTLVASRPVRQWLALRLQAWREGASFEDLQVTPNYLAQLDVLFCPVTRRGLGGAPDGPDAPVITRLRLDAGYAAGNLAVVSQAAHQARAGRDAAALGRLAEQLRRDGVAQHDGLDAAAWARLATLASFADELPAIEAARLPLRVLPPNRVRVLNTAQGLQVLLTLRLAAPGWARRAAAMADALPAPTLRHDFNLFVGAIAARLMGVPADLTEAQQRWAREDAWADLRVQRRWQHLVGQMSAEQAEGWLQRLAGSGLGGLRLMLHERSAATDGWALPTRGRIDAARRAGRVPARPWRAASGAVAANDPLAGRATS